jgi:hypothetical protein
MLFKKTILLLSILASIFTHTYAQNPDFCEGVIVVLNDAPNGFKNIKGRMLESNMNATMWKSTVQIPGTVGYRIVQSMGLFYEAGLLQTTSKDDLRPVYEKYKKLLNDCLSPLGYILSTQDNFTAGISDFKKLVFIKEVNETTTTADLPSHVTMEVTYSSQVGKFTIVLFIFQH